VSLNWREIDAVLHELSLEGSHIQKIRQPDFQSLIFDMYRPKDRFSLLISMAQGKTRIHRLTKQITNQIKLQRFSQFLRSRIKGGRIVEGYQIGSQRIIKITVRRGGEITILWIRLWGGAGNIIATDEKGKVLDAFYRRPGKGEISGGSYFPESELSADKTGDKEYSIREFQGSGDFNAKIENYYDSLDQEKEVSSLQSKAKNVLSKLLAGNENKLAGLRKRLKEYENFGKFKLYGDCIMYSLHSIKKGDPWVSVKDFTAPGEILEIELDPQLTPYENAEHYYEKHRKAKSGLTVIQKEIAKTERECGTIEDQLKNIDKTDEIEILQKIIKENRREPETVQGRKKPGLSFRSGDFILLVGRSARENDELLRKEVKGNDWWLHSRDFPGAYVFIKNIPGKSVPLETLLDAGNLALFYSKARASGKGELYYTQVKYLRRPKDGKKGLVLPTQEKNLSVNLDSGRLKRLQEECRII